MIHKLEEIIRREKLETTVEVKAAFCLGECTKAVSVKIDEGPVHSVTEDTVEDFFYQYLLGR